MLKIRIGLMVLLASGAAAAQATILWSFDTIYFGQAIPSEAAPWGTLSISNGLNAGDVDFVFTNTMPYAGGLNGVNFCGDLFLNTLGNPANITISNMVKVDGFQVGEDAVGPNFGSSQYDVGIIFPDDGHHLIPGQVASWTLHDVGLTENSFLAYTSPGNGKPQAMALLHMQGISVDSSFATPSIVPEPTGLLAIGLGVAALLRRRRN